MRFVTRTMSATVGKAKASRFAAYGIGTSAPLIRSGGASRSSCSIMAHQTRMGSGITGTGTADCTLRLGIGEKDAYEGLLVDDSNYFSANA